MLELCLGGDLRFHLERMSRFNEDTARFYAAEILVGLEEIHSKGWMYRDLKPENILVCSDGHIKISDLGLCCKINPPPQDYAGTRGYWAPEIIFYREGYSHPDLLAEGIYAYDHRVDYWSLGCCVYEFLRGIGPFMSRRATMMCKNRRKAIDKATLEMEIPYQKFYFSPQAQDFCRRLLHRSPAKRLGANGIDEIKQHPWFRAINWVKVQASQVTPPYQPPEESLNAPADESSRNYTEVEAELKAEGWEEDEADQRLYDDWPFVNLLTGQATTAEFLEIQDNLQPEGDDAGDADNQVTANGGEASVVCAIQ